MSASLRKRQTCCAAAKWCDVPIGTRPYRLPAEMDATLTPAIANQGLDGVRLAAAALDRCRRLVAGDKVGRKIETAFGEHGRTFSQFLRLAHDRDIVLHV